jgi:hypothetical protein
MDTSAPFGAGVAALASTETPINRPANAARDIKVFILFSSFFVKSAWPSQLHGHSLSKALDNHSKASLN